MRAFGEPGGPPRSALTTAGLITRADQAHGLAALMAAGGVTKRLPATSLWARGAVIRRVHDLFGGSTGLTGFGPRGRGEEALLRALALVDVGRASADAHAGAPTALAARAQARLDRLWATARRSLVLGAAAPALLRRDGVPGVGTMAAPELWPAFDVAWDRAMRLEAVVRRLAGGEALRVAAVEWLGAALDDLPHREPRGVVPDDDAVRAAVGRTLPDRSRAALLAPVLALCFAGASAGMVWDAMERGRGGVAAEWAPTLMAVVAMEEAAAAT